jgi:hypothetical protein
MTQLLSRSAAVDDSLYWRAVVQIDSIGTAIAPLNFEVRATSFSWSRVAGCS